MSIGEKYKSDASCVMKVILAKKRLKHRDLVAALQKVGVSETESGLRGKLYRGTFEFSWVIACCKALDIKELPLDLD